MNSGLIGALGAAPLRVTGMTRRIVTSAPNANVNALQLQATGGSKNVDFVLTPKGTGSLILGPPPDGTAVGGNKRGVNSVDLQTVRAFQSQIASGQNAFAIGTNNTASGGGGIGGGVPQSAIAIGSDNTASAQFECVAIGLGNSAISSGTYAIGNNNTASAYPSFAFGQNSNADRSGLVTFNSVGTFTERGDIQKILWTGRIKTTNNTPTEILTGANVTDRFTISSGKIAFFLIKITGVLSTGASSAIYMRKVAIKNVSGTTSLVGTVETVGTDYEDDPNTDITITANDTNDALKIDVTGIVGQTWRWGAVLEGIEVKYGT